MEHTLTTAEVAECLHVTVKTVRNYLAAGKLKAYKFGGAYRITEESVKHLIEESKVNFDEEKGE